MSSNDTLRFASLSPNALIITPTFWLKNIIFIAILLVSVGAVFVLFPLTYPKSDDPLAYLSTFIHFFALWGIWVSIRVIAQTQVEHAYALQVEKRAQDKLRKIRSKEIDRLALEQVGELLPDNPTQNLAMPRLFQHIIGEARDHRFESSMSTMQPYREEAIDDIFKLQNIQKIALQLGILGTFIGLILALSQLNLDANSATLELTSLFNSLHISFSTSVAGLEVAAILGLLIMVVRQKQKSYFQAMENAADTMISLAQNSIPEDLFFTGFEQVKNAISQLDDRVYAQTKEVEVQTKEMRRGIDKLADTKTQFREFLDQIQDSQAHFVKEMMAVYDIFSPQTITNELQQSLENAVAQISKTFNENLEPSLEKMTAMNQAIHEVHSVLEKLENKLKEQNQQLEKVNQELVLAKSTLYSSTQPLITAQKDFIDSAVTQLDKGNQELTQSKTDFYGKLNPLIDKQNKTFHDFQRDVKAMSDRVTSLNQELQKSNEVVQDLVQLITDRKPLYKIIFMKLKRFYQGIKEEEPQKKSSHLKS
jgi:biopolymer transport protein ExbB/TolQ